MTSLVTVRSLCIILCFAGLATAQEPPPLEPPDLEPPKADAPQSQAGTTAKPASPKPTSPRPAAPTQPRAAEAAQPRLAPGPMLAIPGVTAPIARPRPAVRPQPASPPQTGISPFSARLDAAPARSVAPTTRRPSLSNGLPPLDALPGPSSREETPLSIEPLEVPSAVRVPTRPFATRPVPRRTPGAGTADPPVEEKGPSAPRRAPGLLGRLFGFPAPQPSREPPRSPSRSTSRRDLESESDAELVAKRRIERQIRETLGDRVSRFEVRITGRNVVIVAQPSRFWFRRSVRRSLETLPALEGYRSRIELSD